MTAAPGTTRPPRLLEDVPGWFPVLDQMLFTWFLERQRAAGVRGDLLEVGVYMGKSAILLGHHRRPGERYTVCDLFEGDAPDGANRAESTKSYASLSRQAFEENYLSFHDELPRVLAGPSSLVPDEVEPGSCRFVHIDASHLYEHVSGDIGAARDLLGPDGIVVLDDFRSEHTPGVSVAAWEAVLNRGLRPVCLSTQKLYGTWGDPAPLQDELLGMVRGRDDCHLSVQEAAGHTIVRLKSKGMRPPPFPFSRHHAGDTGDHSSHGGPDSAKADPGKAGSEREAAARRPSPWRRRTRRIAVDLLPPLLTRAVRNARAVRRARARAPQGSR
ncbi:class I SAM-dependent methyltransferase [Streptomyces sp. NPDC007084]|uniref:class I SAM-dependent methyltransferase n=1 Tax=Streptomyces sp. NPDC007084 TaxID=3154313 RepID=UPI003455680E